MQYIDIFISQYSPDLFRFLILQTLNSFVLFPVIVVFIFLPTFMLDTDQKEILCSVVGHEMVHIRRYDSLMIYLQIIIKIIFFFNPVIWFASSRLSKAREHLCDQEVLKSKLVSPAEYGKALVDVVKFKVCSSRRLPQIAPGFFTKKGRIKTRILKIMDGNEKTEYDISWSGNRDNWIYYPTNNLI